MAATRSPEVVARKILHDLAIKKAPIPLNRIATKLGVELTEEIFEDELSGILVKREDSVVIGFNSSHHKNRQRFTIAHEIGHLVLGHPGEMFVDKTLRQKAVVVRRDGRSSEGTDQHEIEANRFAAELLMPSDLIEVEVSKRLSRSKATSTEVLVENLASLFQVSEKAMEIRLVNLGFSIPQ